MKGFFDLDIIQKANAEIKYTCRQCDLNLAEKRETVYPNSRCDILFILENKMDSLLDEIVERENLGQFGENLAVTCAVKCHPKPKDANEFQIICCQKQLEKEIEEIKPRVIVPLGSIALKVLYQGKVKHTLNINNLRGYKIPDNEYNAWVCPVFGSRNLYAFNNKAAEEIFRQDLIGAKIAAGEELPAYSLDTDLENCTIVETKSQIDELFQTITDGSNAVVFDYETTGLKPHKEGHKIVCTGISVDGIKGYAFPMVPGMKEDWIKFLRNSGCQYVAHNLNFEHLWTDTIFDVEINDWCWDTMLTAHQLDNRPGTKSLKFQTWVNFGIRDYNSHIEPYLKGIEDHANAFNKIVELWKKDMACVMEYCALDAIYEARLYKKQKRILGYE